MNNILIRRAAIPDIPHIIDHRIFFLKELNPDQRINHHTIWYLNDYYTQKMESLQYVSFLAFHQKHCISSAGLVTESFPPTNNQQYRVQGTVFNVYTLPQWRRKGICRNVLEKLIEFARNMKIEKLKLNATIMGKPLYQLLGFTDPNNQAMELDLSKLS